MYKDTYEKVESFIKKNNSTLSHITLKSFVSSNLEKNTIRKLDRTHLFYYPSRNSFSCTHNNNYSFPLFLFVYLFIISFVNIVATFLNQSVLLQNRYQKLRIINSLFSILFFTNKGNFMDT